MLGLQKFGPDATDGQKSFSRLETETTRCSGFQLNLCVSYGSRSEIAGACRRIAARVAAGELRADEVDEGMLSNHMISVGVPDPDLLIRTSGERRLSNFLLWQLAYAEMIFVDKQWPAFGKQDLVDAVAEFARRKRRYGR